MTRLIQVLLILGVAAFSVFAGAERNMRIAIIGFGSLIWNPGNLKIRSDFRIGGPEFPVEFARVSKDKRLTLVISPTAPKQVSWYADSAFERLADAVENLREREEAKTAASIHFLSRENGSATAASGETVEIARLWLNQHPEFDAIVWTGLGSNWKQKTGQAFSEASVVKYLSDLRGAELATAKEYILRAPYNIQTPLRRAIMSHFGCQWALE